MKIITEYPPNIKRIRAVFGEIPKGVVFAYGDTLYNPDNGPVNPALMAHEETHMRQQGEIGVEKWWNYYLFSKDFRLSQEVEAYQNQYKQAKKDFKDRNALAKYLHRLAFDLASPLYGEIISYSEATEAITSDKLITFTIPKL